MGAEPHVREHIIKGEEVICWRKTRQVLKSTVGGAISGTSRQLGSFVIRSSALLPWVNFNGNINTQSHFSMEKVILLLPRVSALECSPASPLPCYYMEMEPVLIKTDRPTSSGHRPLLVHHLPSFLRRLSLRCLAGTDVFSRSTVPKKY